MYYSQITDMPCLLNYDEALAYYNSIKPIRGSDIRPICETANGRRKKHMQICKRPNENITCRLHDTDLLEFYPDGTIYITTGGWSTQSTLQFINALLPRKDFGMWANMQNHQAVLTQDKVPSVFALNIREYLIGTGITLRHVKGSATWDVIDAEPNYSYRVRRKVMNKKMEPVKHFITECLAFSKLYDLNDSEVRKGFIRSVPLRDGKPADSADIARFEWPSTSHSWIYKVIEQPDHESYSRVVQNCLAYSYKEPDYWSRHNGAIPEFDPERTKEFVREIVKHTFAEEIFERVMVDRISKNGNERYFRGE